MLHNLNIYHDNKIFGKISNQAIKVHKSVHRVAQLVWEFKGSFFLTLNLQSLIPSVTQTDEFPILRTVETIGLASVKIFCYHRKSLSYSLPEGMNEYVLNYKWYFYNILFKFQLSLTAVLTPLSCSVNQYQREINIICDFNIITK